MHLRPLSEDELHNLRLLVNDCVQTTLAVPGQFGYVRGGLYPVTWQVGSLQSDKLERVAWLLSQVGFAVQQVTQQSVPSTSLQGVVDEFYTLEATRQTIFLPDCLFGEALVIESIGAPWESHLHRLSLPSDNSSFSSAYASLHGPLGKSIV